MITNLNNLISLGANGLQLASFTEIRSTLIDRYKSVYGSDIDLSTGSADGVFINDLSLIINNLLQLMNGLYSNLNVQYAKGTYLDALCALANVRRKPATYSSTYLLITNEGPTVTYNSLTFVDAAGGEWEMNEPHTFTNGQQISVLVTSTTPGPVKAPAGFIISTVEQTNLIVSQPNEADVGSPIETDDELRNRRAQSSGANGTTVLESLSGALLNVSGIRDVKIYNNNTSISITALDTSTVDAHSVYIIIRRDPNVTIPDSTIANIIHDKLTPGIHSCDSAVATQKSYLYITEVFGQTISESQQNIYWKECVPIHPSISINLTPYSYFTASEIDVIAPQIIEYLNELPIGTAPSENDMIVQLMTADPQYKGLPTYVVSSVTFSSSVNADTYYNYDKYTFDDSTNILTITKEA